MTVLDVINNHRGKESAITAAQVLLLLPNFPGGERQLRDEIKRLIEEEGHLIAASSKVPRGYYVPVTQEKLDEYELILEKRAKSIFVRRQAIIRMRGQLPPQQLKMFEARA